MAQWTHVVTGRGPVGKALILIYQASRRRSNAVGVLVACLQAYVCFVSSPLPTNKRPSLKGVKRVHRLL